MNGYGRLVHLVDQLARKIEAATAARRLAEMPVDFASAAQPGGGRSADFTVAMTVTDAYEHAQSVYECE